MSYASPRTGESVNIYRAENYSKENPVYILKGLDASGNPFEREVDAGRIDPNRCSFNELMVLNVETGHTSPDDYLHAVAQGIKQGRTVISIKWIISPVRKGSWRIFKPHGSARSAPDWQGRYPPPH